MTRSKSQLDWAIDWWFWDRRLSYARHLSQSFLPVCTGSWKHLKKWSRLERFEHWVKSRGLRIDLWQTERGSFAYTVTTAASVSTDDVRLFASESMWFHLATIERGQYAVLRAANGPSLDDYEPADPRPVEPIEPRKNPIEDAYRIANQVEQDTWEWELQLIEEEDVALQADSLKQAIHETYKRAMGEHTEREEIYHKVLKEYTDESRVFTERELGHMESILDTIYHFPAFAFERSVTKGPRLQEHKLEVMRCAKNRRYCTSDCSCLERLAIIQNMVNRAIESLRFHNSSHLFSAKKLTKLDLTIQEVLFAIRTARVPNDLPENRRVSLETADKALKDYIASL